MTNKPIVKLSKAQLYFDDGEYFLKLEYYYEDGYGIYNIVYPKVCINIPTTYLPEVVEEKIWALGPRNLVHINFGDEEHILRPDKNGNFVYKKLLKKKVREMTIEEIENELCCNIKIVSDKNKEE